MTNYLASIKIPRILNLLMLIFISYTISFTIMPDESRASWDCFRALHKQAISDAVHASPADFKKVLVPLEDTMLKQVDVIQNTSKPDRKSFGSYFKNIVEAAKDSDPMRNEYMARNMVDITIYIFDAYCPLKISFCDENEILKRASVVYDGYSPNPDYARISSPAFDTRQQLSGEVTRMLSFYNTLVNEILDLWVTIWKDAGRDISGLPEENTLVRGTIIKGRETVATVGNLGRPDNVLQKHKFITDRTTADRIAEDRKKLAEIKIKIQELEKGEKTAELTGSNKDDKRLGDELRRLYIEMDHLQLKLIKSETD